MEAIINIKARNPTRTLREIAREVLRDSVDSAGNSNVTFNVTDSYLGIKTAPFRVHGISYIPKTATIEVKGDFNASNVENIICDSGYTIEKSRLKISEQPINSTKPTTKTAHADYVK